jgi:DNA repair protein RadD
MIKLRGYQEDAKAGVRDALATHSAVLLVAPTGAGKTVLFANIAQTAAARGFRVLILAHRDTLIKQASRKLMEYGVQHGIIMAGYTPNLALRVQVASVQTIVRRLDKITRPFDIVIVDEAHLSAAKSYVTIIEALRKLNPGVKLLGVTGSPCRLDGKGLGKEAGGLYETIVMAPNIRWMIDQAYLVRPDVYGAKKLVDLTGIKKVGGDYDGAALAEVMDKPKITGDAIEHYKALCPGVPAVAWCASVAHAEHVAEQFNAAGIPALALSGEDDAVARERALAGLASGALKVVTFAMLLVEGVDCPAIGAIIMLRPTMSLASYLQVIGRGLRPIFADGYDLETLEGRRAAIAAGPKGDCCYVLDHAGLWVKHGFAEEDREWSLDGAPKKPGKRKPNEPVSPARQCPKCYSVHPPADVCPKCGHVYETGRKLETEEGELVKITPEMRAVMTEARRKQIRKAKTLEELQSLGRAFGYSERWAEGTWKAKQKIREQYTKRHEVPIEVYEADIQSRR